MKVLTRYLLRTHVGPFLFAFVALTSVLLINVIAQELASLAGKGLPLDVVLEFFVLSLPANIALTLPMAVLVAVLFTFTTLASENEIAALRASGVDLRRATLPLVVLAALIAIGMVWFNDRVLPAANFRWRVLMTDVAQTRPLLAIRPQTLNSIATSDGRAPYVLEAGRIDAETGRLWEVTIYDVSDGSLIRTIKADSGRMAFNQEQTDLLLTLHNGTVWEVDFSDTQRFQLVEFEQQIMQIKGVSNRLERNFGSDYRTDRDMTSGMMRAAIDSLRFERVRLASGDTAAPVASVGDDPDAALPAERESDAMTATLSDRISAEVDEAARSAMEAEVAMSQPMPSSPVDSAGNVAMTAADSAVLLASQRFVRQRIAALEYQIREYQLEIHKKYSIAGATLVFVLIGIPLALRFPRGGIGMVIGVSLAIFGIYYVGLIGGETLGDRGLVPPVLAMWLTNIMFGVLGLLGFVKLGHEQGSGRGSGWGEWPRWLHRRKTIAPSEAA
jgi:lipopolysaccharide export system permease protein